MLRRTVALAMAATALSCTTWKTTSVSPERYVSDRKPNRIRVALWDGRWLQLDRPVIRDDSLHGELSAKSGVFVGVPLSNVRGIQSREVDPWSTGVMVLAAGVTGFLVASSAQDDSPPPQRPAPTAADGFNIGSCPLVYSWNGSEWKLDSGTFSGSITAGAARTEVDNLIYAAPDSGILRLKLTNEMPETDYVDALTLLAIDHQPGTEIVPDAFGRLHTVSGLSAPVRARDFRGRDAVRRIAAADGWQWESGPSGRDSARTEDIRDGLELTFTRPAGAAAATLVLDATNTPWAGHLKIAYIRAHGSATRAWYDSLDANPAMAARLAETMIREAYLVVWLWADGRWHRQGFLWETGAEVGKRHAVQLDLSPVREDTVRIRLESAPSFWLVDYAAIDYSQPTPFSRHDIAVSRVGGPVGVDVRRRLATVDRDYVQLETGDSYELEYMVPDVPAGMQRSYLLASNGWYRIHTNDAGPAQIALLKQAETQPYGISKIAVARLNEAIRRLEESAR